MAEVVGLHPFALPPCPFLGLWGLWDSRQQLELRAHECLMLAHVQAAQ